MANTYRFGPGYILVADSISDPADEWTDLGYTRGITVDATNADVSFGRVDQNGIPTTDAIWVAPRGFEIRASLLDKDAAKIVKSLPGAVRVTSGAKEAVTLPSTPATVSTKAVAIIPHDEYTSGDPWIDANNAIWLKEAYLTLDSVPAGGEVTDDDDAISALELRITRAMPNAAGIGSPVVGAPETNPQGVQFAWQPIYDGIVPKVRDSYTFSRASTATYVDADGVVQTAGVDVPRYTAAGRPIVEPQRTNLITASEDYGAYWSKSRATVTANATTAPDGTLTADKFVEDSTTNTRQVYQDRTCTTTAYCWSGYFKSAERDWFYLREFTSGSGVYFDIANGAVGQVGSLIEACGIESVGNGWYRCWMVLTKTDTNFRAFIMGALSDGVISYLGDGSSGFYMWGSQLEAHDGPPTSYIPTSGATATRSADVWGGAGTFTRASTATYVKDGVVKYAGTDEPRIQDSGLLLEPQRTNIIPNSADYSPSPWAKINVTISTNTTTAPDGTKTADQIVEDTATSSHYIYEEIPATASSVYTISTYVKPNGRTWVGLYSWFPNMGRWFNLEGAGSTGAVYGGAPDIGEGIELVGDGWYRIWISVTASTTVTRHVVTVGNADGGSTFTGDGSSGLFVWGGQTELGSYPTSYIPTSGSSVSRSVDYLLHANSNQPSVQEDWTLLLEADQKGLFAGATQFPLMSSATPRLSALYTNGTDYFVEIAGFTLDSSETINLGGDPDSKDLLELVFSSDEDGNLTAYLEEDGVSTGSLTPEAWSAIKNGSDEWGNTNVLYMNGSEAWEVHKYVITKGAITPAQIRKFLR